MPESARRLGISLQAVHRLVASGKLGENRKVGTQRLVREREVDGLALARRQERGDRDWILLVEAARILGVSRYVIYKRATAPDSGIATKRSQIIDAILVRRQDIEAMAGEHDDSSSAGV
jgi:excisionase family DNA binding protein